MKRRTTTKQLHVALARALNSSGKFEQTYDSKLDRPFGLINWPATERHGISLVFCIEYNRIRDEFEIAIPIDSAFVYATGKTLPQTPFEWVVSGGLLYTISLRVRNLHPELDSVRVKEGIVTEKNEGKQAIGACHYTPEKALKYLFTWLDELEKIYDGYLELVGFSEGVEK